MSDPASQLWLRDWSLMVGQQTGGGPPAAPAGKSTVENVNPDTAEFKSGKGDDAPFYYGKDPTSKGGDGVDLGNLRFTFKVTKSVNGSPWLLEAHINNISQTTVTRITQQYGSVELSAGYRAPSTQYGVIFTGQINWYERGREANQTDTYLTINAMNRDAAINGAMINTVLPAGHTHRDIIKASADAMGLKVGFITKLIGSEQIARARALFGMARDPLRDIYQHYGATAHVDDSGVLHVLGPNDTVPGDTIILNSDTGLVGVPTMTMGGGITARCLLNPNINPGSTVHINEQDINRIMAAQGNDLIAQKAFLLEHQTAGIAVQGNGVYRVVQVVHQGDNRGNDWYSDMVLTSANPNDPQIPISGEAPKPLS